MVKSEEFRHFGSTVFSAALLFNTAKKHQNLLLKEQQKLLTCVFRTSRICQQGPDQEIVQEPEGEPAGH